MIDHRIALLAALGILAALNSAHADQTTLSDTSLTLNITEVLSEPPQPAPSADRSTPAPDPITGEPHVRALGYGQAGSRWWTIGAAYANDFKSNNDFNLHVAFSQFLTDELEFALEGAGWYFNQTGDDTGGLSASMIFRWHFLHADNYRWTIFADAGIGILGAFDNVPDGGTGFNFLPRIGGGFTWALDEPVDGESRGARLMVGLRYHHISNGRIASDSSNPARDALMGYVAIVFPF